MLIGFGKKHSSVNTAKCRLQILLTADRTNCTPDNLNHMRSDILNMISRYMNIDSERAEICMRQQSFSQDCSRSILTIQVPVEHNK